MSVIFAITSIPPENLHDAGHAGHTLRNNSRALASVARSEDVARRNRTAIDRQGGFNREGVATVLRFELEREP